MRREYRGKAEGIHQARRKRDMKEGKTVQKLKILVEN
jgi:hypothetical protein